MAVSLEDLADKTNNTKAKVLANALDNANSQFLRNNKSPSRKAGELDTRGSHFYLAMYWAQALAEQGEDAALQSTFIPIAKQLSSNEQQIVEELNSVQGQAVDLSGYYRVNKETTAKIMRPSDRFNAVINSLG